MSRILDAMDALARAKNLNRMFLMASAGQLVADEKAIAALADVIERQLEEAEEHLHHVQADMKEGAAA